MSIVDFKENSCIITHNTHVDDDEVKETPLYEIKARILKKEMTAADDDEMESQTYIERDRKNSTVYFRLFECMPTHNYYLVLVIICAALLHNNNLSYFYTDDQLNVGLLGGDNYRWWS